MSVSSCTARRLLTSGTRSARLSPRNPSQSHHAGAAPTPPPPYRRPFSTTLPRPKRRRPHYPSIKAADLAKIDAAAAHFRPYAPEEKAALAQRYTPAQMAAVDAAEASIDPRDLATQMKLRLDTARLDYFDDLSRLSPVLDKRVRTADEEARAGVDPGAFPKTTDEMADSMRRFIERTRRKAEKGTSEVDWEVELAKFLDDPRNVFHARDPQALLHPVSAVAPEIPKGWNETEALEEGAEEVEEAETAEPGEEAPAEGKGKGKGKGGPVRQTDREEEDPRMRKLMRDLGLSRIDMKKFKVKALVVHRVTNQTRLGKISRYYFLTIAGDGAGLLGIGEGKSAEPEDGRRQAMIAAIRNMRPVPRYERRTIYGEVDGKSGATELRLSARPPGFGVRCQHLIFEMARAAGISDLAARVHRARNPMNTVKAAFQALMKQRIPEEIARVRGRKLVDVRKVYYGGKVY